MFKKALTLSVALALTGCNTFNESTHSETMSHNHPAPINYPETKKERCC